MPSIPVLENPLLDCCCRNTVNSRVSTWNYTFYARHNAMKYRNAGLASLAQAIGILTEVKAPATLNIAFILVLKAFS